MKLYLSGSALLVFAIIACTHTTPSITDKTQCASLIDEGANLRDTQTLELISQLYKSKCFVETIAWANKVHKTFENKSYSYMQETIEFFIPEGTVTDYVLESYERAYLRFLTAASYLQMQDRQSAMVELRKYYHEERAQTYNYGLDPVNALLQAAMWDRIDEHEFTSRPFWLRVAQADDVARSVKDFASAQLRAIDSKMPRPQWQIHEVGNFPGVNWKLNFISAKNGYLEIKPKGAFPRACTANNEVLLPTADWFHKIAVRHSQSYHPLVNTKSWVRAPFAALYFITTIAAGAGIAVGGCALDISAKGDGGLCAVSIKGGFVTLMKSGDVVNYTLKPDLRHWNSVPGAILLTSETNGPTCLAAAGSIEHRRML